MAQKKYTVVCNWKMNPATLLEAKNLYKKTAEVASEAKKTSVVVCPPFVFLADIAKKEKKNVFVGSQDVFFEPAGSFTGEVSVPMLSALGVSHVIVGHSERRKKGDTNETVSKKLRAVLSSGISAILCIGEEKRTEDGSYLAELKEQILSSIGKLPKQFFTHLIMAYEPVWAIGASRAMSPRDVHETTIYIKKVLTDTFGKDIATSIPILYGGSVNPQNTKDIIVEGGVKGLLVGRDSLVAENISGIIRLVDSCA